MANWVIRCAQSWLKPLYKHMKRQLLEQSVIHADETVVQVLKEDNKPAASESRECGSMAAENTAASIFASLSTSLTGAANARRAF